MALPPIQSFTPGEFQPLYLQINSTNMDLVDTINISRSDGGMDVVSLNRDYAGRFKGAAKTMISFSGSVPYSTPDVGGEGFDSGGMAPGGSQLDQLILASLNTGNTTPVTFTVMLGNPAVQQLVFKGFITDLEVDQSVGKVTRFSAKGSGSFNIFS